MAEAATSCIRNIELTLGDGTVVRAAKTDQGLEWGAKGASAEALTGATINLTGSLRVAATSLRDDSQFLDLQGVTVEETPMGQQSSFRQVSLTLDDGTNVTAHMDTDGKLRWEGYGVSWHSLEGSCIILSAPGQVERSIQLSPAGMTRPQSIKIRPDLAQIDGKMVLVVQHNLDEILGDETSVFLSAHELDGTHEVLDYDPTIGIGSTFHDTDGPPRWVDEIYLQDLAVQHFREAASVAGLDLPVELMSAEEASRRRPRPYRTVSGERSSDHLYAKMVLSGGEETTLDKNTRTYGFNVDPHSKYEQYSAGMLSALHEQIESMMKSMHM